MPKVRSQDALRQRLGVQAGAGGVPAACRGREGWSCMMLLMLHEIATDTCVALLIFVKNWT